MKKAIVLSHADVVTALTAFVAEQEPKEQIADIQFSLNGDGEVTAVVNTEETETKSARGNRRAQGKDDSAEQEAEVKTTSRRGSRSQPKDDEPETKPARSSRSSRNATTEPADDGEEAPTSTRSRRGSKVPAKPTLVSKGEDEYEVGAEEQDDENVTFWQNNEEASDVFSVPAGQLLPDPDLYTEIESEEAALELLAGEPEDEPEVETKSTRTRRSSKSAEDDAPAETATRSRRGTAKTEDAPATSPKRRVFGNRGK